ncbi:fumarylacetoacetate hydrolase family protein [Chachezhania antarctica]|uniref:fumarylacetoacetate hydrolase family protein n=1 Tax=Chachezhania antarctica TaxID=2340860 RepID=UPI000EB526E9|nr:fumarylacetoacetate hydrolase family protein [Chachezhania antarctica]|tara:strand:- start:2249 stop:3097 length:849 start_codon:yes stop_codon:yes gene_type:complete
MRLVSFTKPDGTASYGTATDDQVFDAGAALGAEFPTLRSVLTAGATDRLDGTGEAIAMADVTLLPPIPEPEKILCIGLNYLPHILESGRPHPEYPSIFTRYPRSLVGHNVPIERPEASREFDYEGELALVIGKAGRHIAAEDAWDHIAGYSCFNEGSIRDYQNHTTQFWPGKSFERSGSMGPWIVTSDEVGDIREQSLTTRVNGNVEQHTPISDLAIGIPELIAYASTVLTLVPGDVIATGTPGGVGRYRKPQLFLEPGMNVEVEITGVGTLVNPVIAETSG